MHNYSPNVVHIAKGDKFSLDQCSKNGLKKESMKNILDAAMFGCLG